MGETGGAVRSFIAFVCKSAQIIMRGLLCPLFLWYGEHGTLEYHDGVEDSLDHFIWGVGIAVSFGLSLFSAGHALLFKRDPRSAFGWIGINLTVPLAGPFLYWTMGVNRIHRRARQWLES